MSFEMVEFLKKLFLFFTSLKWLLRDRVKSTLTQNVLNKCIELRVVDLLLKRFMKNDLVLKNGLIIPYCNVNRFKLPCI